MQAYVGVRVSDCNNYVLLCHKTCWKRFAAFVLMCFCADGKMACIKTTTVVPMAGKRLPKQYSTIDSLS